MLVASARSRARGRTLLELPQQVARLRELPGFGRERRRVDRPGRIPARVAPRIALPDPGAASASPPSAAVSSPAPSPPGCCRSPNLCSISSYSLPIRLSSSESLRASSSGEEPSCICRSFPSDWSSRESSRPSRRSSRRASSSSRRPDSSSSSPSTAMRRSTGGRAGNRSRRFQGRSPVTATTTAAASAHGRRRRRVLPRMRRGPARRSPDAASSSSGPAKALARRPSASSSAADASPGVPSDRSAWTASAARWIRTAQPTPAPARPPAARRSPGTTSG